MVGVDDGYWGQREKRLLNIGKCYFTLGQFYGRIVIKLCLSVDVAESEDEELLTDDAVSSGDVFLQRYTIYTI